MFYSVQQPYLLILANLQSNKRHKKEAPRFSHLLGLLGQVTGKSQNCLTGVVERNLSLL